MRGKGISVFARLPQGKTCQDCGLFSWCKELIQQKPDAKICDWDPSKFYEEGATDQVLYRYDNWATRSEYAEWKQAWDIEVTIHMSTHRIIRRTACGVWIDAGLGKPRFVLTKARKRWACPTRKEALTSFLARKERQLVHLQREAAEVQAALNKAKTLTGEEVGIVV